MKLQTMTQASETWTIVKGLRCNNKETGHKRCLWCELLMVRVSLEMKESLVHWYETPWDVLFTGNGQGEIMKIYKCAINVVGVREQLHDKLINI